NGGQVLTGNAIMLIDPVVKPDTSNILMAFTDRRAYKFNTGTVLFEDITRNVTAPSTGPAAVGSNSGGSLASGTYDVTYTWVNGAGETTESPMTQSSAVVGPNGKVTVTIPALPLGVTSANIYARIHNSPRKLQGNTVTTTFVITTILTATDPPV